MEPNQNNNPQVPPAPMPAPQPGGNLDIPSSLSSVSIRTMESDVETLKKTGGVRPIPEIIQAAPFSKAEQPSVMPAPESVPMASTTGSTGMGMWGWILGILGLIVLFLVGYFVLPKFF